MNAIDNLDSRALRLTDCYGQRFMREGRFSWNALPAGGAMMVAERPFTIEARPRTSKGQMAQHDVVLRWNERRFVPDRAELTIEVGDLVIWHCPDASAPGYEIAGDQAFFGSASLVNECGYSHAFGMPGRYEWADANGTGLRGVVVVVPMHCKGRDDLARWHQQISEAALVMIQGGKADPAEVQIVVGQRVYFAIVTGPGITVTDRRLLVRGADCGGTNQAATSG